ncbi:MAG: TROVE domain-containing protein [Candidatus Heimdallarchaeota archaeon]|nr:TROVE domain-containing protein [Candidatus Heimdallarchaeota archaeon]
MPKVGFDKGHIDGDLKAREVDSERVPGVAYNIDDPSLRLVNRVAGGFFNEPDYYDKNRSNIEFLIELRSKGVIKSVPSEKLGLSQVACEIIADVEELAQSEQAEDILIIANWMRNEMHIRYTPSVLLAIASHHENSKKYVRHYAPHILKRADDPVNTFAFYRHIYQKDKYGHKGTIPHSLKKGLVAALQQQSIYQLLKWNKGSVHPNIADLLIMLRNTKQNGRNAVSKAVFEYMVNNKIMDDAPAQIRKREQWEQISMISEDAITLAREIGLTHEQIKSKFGGTREVYEAMISHDMYPYMAMLKNLANFERVGISSDHWKLVEERMNAVDASNTKQLPFRYWSAFTTASSHEAKEVISKQLDRAVDNVPELPGRTFIIGDYSGSVIGTAVSQGSKLMVSQAETMLMSIIAKRMGDTAKIGVFGDLYSPVPFQSNQAVMDIAKTIEEYAHTRENSKYIGEKHRSEYSQGVGGSTETGLWFAIDHITREMKFFDRIILMSDLQCYTQGDINCGVNMKKFQFISRERSIAALIREYRRQVNPDVQVYSINLQQYQQSIMDHEDSRVHLMSGWSEKIINIIAGIEKVEPQKKEVISSIDVIRERFRVSA